jgi:hypothetical protein
MICVCVCVCVCTTPIHYVYVYNKYVFVNVYVNICIVFVSKRYLLHRGTKELPFENFCLGVGGVTKVN